MDIANKFDSLLTSPVFLFMQSLGVFENRILRRIFGPKRDENGEWRRLHNDELLHLYHSPKIFRGIKPKRLKWADHIVRMEECRSAFKILTSTLTGRRPLERPRW